MSIRRLLGVVLGGVPEQQALAFDDHVMIVSQALQSASG
jgi:hypothetical protein